MSNKKIQIAVIGGREVSAEVLEKAETIGRLIAENGAIILCGGLGGVMEAVCRGAKSVNGTTVGILPTSNKTDANSYVDISIPTDMGVARNAVIIQSADAAIAVGGSYGTLSEMAFALQKKIPLVSVDSWSIDETVMKISDPVKAIKWIFESITLKSKNI
ncbi:TIGR00725 family protein [candidate division KSB1 bacterium]|nr:TIGR00725 family protein [candidate division KSB1 bacterium]